MALVTPTVTLVGDGYGNVYKITWALTTADHTGVAVGEEYAQHTDACWQFTDTGSGWGGATAAAQISNINTDGLFGSAKNAAGAAAITATADSAPMQQIEKPFFMRPKLTTVGSGATVTATLLLRRNRI